MPLTTAEAAAEIGISRSTISRYVAEGFMRTHCVLANGQLLFSADEVDRIKHTRRPRGFAQRRNSAA